MKKLLQKIPRNILIISSIVLILLILYFGFVLYFCSHFFFRTNVNGVKSGGKNSTTVAQEYQNLSSDYTLYITDRNQNVFEIHSSDISYEYTPCGQEADLIKEQNPFTWPVSILKEKNLSATEGIHYDEEALHDYLLTLDLFSEDYIIVPQNAYIQIHSDNYEIITEEIGNAPIENEVLSEIQFALNNGYHDITLTDACYEAPSVTTESEKLLNATEQIDSYLASTIHYTISGADENLTSDMILGMLEISSDYEVSINESKVSDFVQTLATKYNTYADVRNFQTSFGDTIAIGGGDYGWVINKTKETKQILTDLASGTAQTREPIYEQRAAQSGLNDIGNTYVEIDYTNQHLWFYKNGVLFTETDIVSGNINRNNGSPDGIFKIVYKESPATLVGEDYSSPVNYFMPFAYNVGIHDATWRSQFGGQIYKSSGSHGCINVPYEIAKTIYENIAIDTPVIAYYREPVILTAENARISNAYSYVAN